MNLDYGPEYEEFRKQVKDFCKKYQGLVFSDSYGPRLGGDKKSENSNGLTMTRSEWQRILIEQGYFAREIPKEYGGYGGTIDFLKNKIIDFFSKNIIKIIFICNFSNFKNFFS